MHLHLVNTPVVFALAAKHRHFCLLQRQKPQIPRHEKAYRRLFYVSRSIRRCVIGISFHNQDLIIIASVRARIEGDGGDDLYRSAFLIQNDKAFHVLICQRCIGGGDHGCVVALQIRNVSTFCSLRFNGDLRLIHGNDRIIVTFDVGNGKSCEPSLKIGIVCIKRKNTLLRITGWGGMVQ